MFCLAEAFLPPGCLICTRVQSSLHFNLRQSSKKVVEVSSSSVVPLKILRLWAQETARLAAGDVDKKAGKLEDWTHWNCFESHSSHSNAEIALDYILKLFNPHPSEVNEMFASDLNGFWNRPAMLLMPSNTSFTCRMKVLLLIQWASLLLPPLSVSMGP